MPAQKLIMVAKNLPETNINVAAKDLELLAAGKLPAKVRERAQALLVSLQSPVDNAARAMAKDCYNREGELEFDDGAVVSDLGVEAGGDNGAYVMSWSWVDFEGTPLDKEPLWVSEIPSNSQEWDFVRHGNGAAAAVEKINAKLLVVVREALASTMLDGQRDRHRDEAEKTMIDFMSGFGFGAGDTEPRAIVARVIEAAFDEFPEFGADKNATKYRKAKL